MTNLALILWNLDRSNSLTINQVGDLFSCLRSRFYEYHHALPQRGSITKPRVGRVFCGLPWGRDAGMQSTLKGLCEDATPLGLDLYESTTQGWRRFMPPTLGSEMLPFQGS